MWSAPSRSGLTTPYSPHPPAYITPHIAWATQEARQRLMQATVDNVSRFLAGQPTHVVN
jgi:glycerate dehydrogenase